MKANAAATVATVGLIANTSSSLNKTGEHVAHPFLKSVT